MALEIVEVHRVEIGEPSDHRPVVRVTHEGLREERFDERALRVVFIAQPALFFHHFPLGLEFVRVQNQPLHAVGFEFEGERHAIGGQVLKVGGEVLAGKRVIHSAVLANQSGKGALGVLGRAFEHHMFKHVGQPGPAHDLVS